MGNSPTKQTAVKLDVVQIKRLLDLLARPDILTSGTEDEEVPKLESLAVPVSPNKGSNSSEVGNFNNSSSSSGGGDASAISSNMLPTSDVDNSSKSTSSSSYDATTTSSSWTDTSSTSPDKRTSTTSNSSLSSSSPSIISSRQGRAFSNSSNYCNIGGRASVDLKADCNALKELLVIGFSGPSESSSKLLNVILDLGIMNILIDIFEDASGIKDALIETIGILTFIMKIAGGENNSNFLKTYCDGRLLNALMKMARFEHIEVQLATYQIIKTLSEAEELKLSMVKKELDLLSLFSYLIYEERGKIRLLSCQIISNLSTITAIQLQLLNLVTLTPSGEQLSFVRIMTDVIRDDRREARILALQTVLNISSTNKIDATQEVYSEMLCLMVGLLDMKAKKSSSVDISVKSPPTSPSISSDYRSPSGDQWSSDNMIVQLYDLQMNICSFFINITTASDDEALTSENRKYLTSQGSKLNFLYILINIIRMDNAECRLRASCIIWNLSIERDIQVFLCDPEMGLLYALMYVLQDDHYKTQQSKVYTCRTLKNLASTPQNHELMLASDLNLLPVMMDIINEDKSYSCVNLCAVLSNFADSEENLKKLLSPDLHIYSTLSSIIKRGKGDQRMHSCQILQKFSTIYDNKIALLSSSHGLISSFALVIGEDKTDARVYACSALYNLIIDFDDRILTSSRGVVSRNGNEIISAIIRLLREEKCDSRARNLTLKILNHLSRSQSNQTIIAGSNELLAAVHRVLRSPLYSPDEVGRTGAQWKYLTEEEFALICSFYCNITDNHENTRTITDTKTHGSGQSADESFLIKDFIDTLFAKLLLFNSADDSTSKLVADISRSSRVYARQSICGILSNFSSANILSPSKELSLALCRQMAMTDSTSTFSKLRQAVYTVFYHFSLNDEYLKEVCATELAGETSIVETILTAITASQTAATEPCTSAIKAVWNISQVVHDGVVPKELVALVASPKDSLRLDMYTALWNLSERNAHYLHKNIRTFVKSDIHSILLSIFSGCGSIGGSGNVLIVGTGNVVESTVEQRSMILNILLNLSLHDDVTDSLATSSTISTLSKWLHYKDSEIISLKSRILYAQLLRNDNSQSEPIRMSILDSITNTYDHILRNEGGSSWDAGTFNLDVIISAALALSEVSLYNVLISQSVELLSLLLKALTNYTALRKNASDATKSATAATLSSSLSSAFNSRRLSANSILTAATSSNKYDIDIMTQVLEITYNIARIIKSNEIFMETFMDPALIELELLSDISYQRSFHVKSSDSPNFAQVLGELSHLVSSPKEEFSAKSKMQLKYLCDRLAKKGEFDISHSDAVSGGSNS